MIGAWAHKADIRAATPAEVTYARPIFFRRHLPSRTVRNVRRTQPDDSGPMAGHVRQGRRYLPELAATGVLHFGDWIRDDLPDLLWPALLLAHSDTDAARGFVRWQAAVQTDLRGAVEPKTLAEGLDGRLTSLDRLVGLHPDAAVVVKQRAAEFDLLPRLVIGALATYPERPAAWLGESDLLPPGQNELDLVAKAVLEVLRDGHREALIKCLSIWSAVQAGTFSSDQETIELLKTYPNHSGSRAKADSVVRASWGAAKGAVLYHDASHFEASIRWAKIFWGFNSMTTRCVRRREIEKPVEGSAAGATDDTTPHSGERPSDGEPPPGGEHLQQLAMDLVASYVEALETAPSRLYDQERQEVHAGLVTRAGREVITVLGCRDLWCTEHGSHVIRTIVEVRIYLQWMATQDPTIYRRFQEYGSGKAKLYARIMDELPDEARIPGFSEAIEELDRLSHNHHAIDHRVVDTSDSFAGKSIRAMAMECGLLDLYRHAYYIASGVAHSEWWSVETHAMERCLNVLHRGHFISSLSLNSGGSEPLAKSWVDQLYTVMRMSLRILGTDQAAVSCAFAWLDDDGADIA